MYLLKNVYSVKFFFTSIVCYVLVVKCNKVPDLCIFLNQSAPSYNLFGVSKSQPDSRIYDQDISIPEEAW